VKSKRRNSFGLYGKEKTNFIEAKKRKIWRKVKEEKSG
jgi:hypothetical protein